MYTEVVICEEWGEGEEMTCAWGGEGVPLNKLYSAVIASRHRSVAYLPAVRQSIRVQKRATDNPVYKPLGGCHF